MKFKSLIILAILIFLPAVFANAQEVQENQNTERQNIRPQRLFEQLGLSREQIQQIRRINRDKQPLMKEAQEKLREANRALDVAIYANTPNEEEVKNRLKDVQMAHAEVLKIRTVMEFEVRKVLTAEQLAKFIRLREEFERNQQERKINNNRPNGQRNY
ncbi:MAG TPA: periplasmic heavy metal sensor [Pyrinomonadaceae bacterium]|nr:periplasmic heavy metal sensor [Pyrinomonadaceae bacterium]